jgi:hypothetical protein
MVHKESIIISKSESRDPGAKPLLFSLTVLWCWSQNIPEATQRLLGASQECRILIAVNLCNVFNQVSFLVLKSHHFYVFLDLCKLNMLSNFSSVKKLFLRNRVLLEKLKLLN